MSSGFPELSFLYRYARSYAYEYTGKVLLIVNTASKCGFTPQYKGLEELYQKYRDQGFVVIGFPCNQFMEQEPGSSAEIAEFCSLRYGVSFPLSEKVDVRGETAIPLYRYLTTQTRLLRAASDVCAAAARPFADGLA